MVERHSDEPSVGATLTSKVVNRDRRDGSRGGVRSATPSRVWKRVRTAPACRWSISWTAEGSAIPDAHMFSCGAYDARRLIHAVIVRPATKDDVMRSWRLGFALAAAVTKADLAAVEAARTEYEDLIEELE